jgi:hypothetical protein
METQGTGMHIVMSANTPLELGAPWYSRLHVGFFNLFGSYNIDSVLQ